MSIEARKKDLSAYFHDMSAELRDDSSRSLFIGFGLVTGTIRNSGTWEKCKRIAGPIIYCPVQPITEDVNQPEDWEIAWEAITLNNDLITVLAENSDEESDNGWNETSALNPNVLRKLREIEIEINAASGDLDEMGSLASRVMQELGELLSGEGKVQMASEQFDEDDLDSLVADETIRVFPEVYYFVAPVPDVLSVFESLSTLSQESNDARFAESLIGRILEGALVGQKVDIGKQTLPPEALDAILAHLPMPISKRQKDAISRALQNQLSFIQGPPGTGKSHTITAIMMACAMLGKRVLMVSHKSAAIDIVARKLRENFGQHSVITLGGKPDDRKTIQSTLAHWQNILGAYNIEKTLREHKEHCMFLDSSFKRLAESTTQHELDLKRTLTCEGEYFQTNQKFVQLRDAFQNAFDLAEEEITNLLTTARITKRLMKSLLQARSLLCSPDGTLKRKECIQIKRIYAAACCRVDLDKQRLDISAAAGHYIEKVVELLEAWQKERSKRKSIAEDAAKSVRRSLELAKSKHSEAKRNLLANQFAYRRLQQISLYSEAVNGFSSMLRWKRPSRVAKAMENVDYTNLLDVFPLWVGEMRWLSQYLPMAAEMFDYVIVDEASQVNIAEVLPALYRGKQLCIVGDQKQLGLSSAGLFSLNKCYEEILWNQHVGANNVSYRHAEEYHLLVSKCSILDFVTARNNAIPVERTVLDEHYRSLPRLAGFTSKLFYEDDGGLVLMRQGSANNHKECFHVIQTGGTRSSYTKLVEEEVDATITLLTDIIKNKSYLVGDDLVRLGYTEERPPTIGVLSFLTDQRNALAPKIESKFTEEQLRTHAVLVGTPEEFQGNERNIMIITLGLDGTSRWGKGHYENPNRFNVATSRATDFTYVIFGALPANANLLKRYLRWFGFETGNEYSDEGNKFAGGSNSWVTADESRCESEFERRVLSNLFAFADKYKAVAPITIHNQVLTCGNHRLDFVVVNQSNKEGCAIEVDGRLHYCDDGIRYSDEHLERIDMLKRAGWSIVNVPYYWWYKRGWLCDDNDAEFCKMANDLEAQIAVQIGLIIP